jgi:hypothetical protein
MRDSNSRPLIVATCAMSIDASTLNVDVCIFTHLFKMMPRKQNQLVFKSN